MGPRKTDKVIAHFLDGTLLKGTTLDFYPTRAKFQLTTEDGKAHQVHIKELKALFFVKDFHGRPEYRERKGFFVQPEQGNKILVEFFDGEVLFGYSITYSPKGYGFFMVPGDPESNNLKVFVVHSSTKRVKLKHSPAGAKGRTRARKTGVKSRA